MIPVNTPAFQGNEKKYLAECIDSGWVSSDGPFVRQFENNFANYVGRKYAVAVSNGTAAIDVAIKALQLKEGDEIILPTFTIISCIHEIIRSGLKPVFVDSDLSTWNMDVSKIESLITSKTRAIMVVHIYSFPVDLKPIENLAKEHNLFVIEDAAEMHGQTYQGKQCGSFGDISTFSFYPNKHITTGEGGMILTDNEHFYERAKSLRNLCFNSERRFVHYELGFNYRMTNLQAALGVAQLEYIDDIIKRKREVGRLYRSLLKATTAYSFLPDEFDYAENIYWVFGILLTPDIGIDADSVMKKLAEKSIGTRPFFYPLHLQPVLKDMVDAKKKYPNAEILSNYGLYLPSGLGITNEQIEEVASIINDIFK